MFTAAGNALNSYRIYQVGRRIRGRYWSKSGSTA